MDPSYESDEKNNESEDRRRDAFMRSRGSSFIRRGKVPSRILEREESEISEREIMKRIEATYNESLEMSADTDYVEWDPTVSQSESSSGVTTVTPQASLSTGVSETYVKINESEKIWHYTDPSGKQQGPFSIMQLRKLNNTGYFPADLRIWKATEKQENSILLADALDRKFPEESPVQSMFPSTIPFIGHMARVPYTRIGKTLTPIKIQGMARNCLLKSRPMK